MKKTTKKIVHAMTKQLLTNGPQYTSVGICNNTYDNIPKLDLEQEMELKELMTLWPESSGNHSYPVPSGSKRQKNPLLAYTKRNNMWNKKSAYGSARWRLVEWLHEQTK
jgi:hypothetical protein